MEAIGDRMKNNYENRSRFYLTRRTPVIVRLDGKAFHSVTNGCAKPFCDAFLSAMRFGAIYCKDNMQGFKMAYIQSDEVSFLLTDYDTLQTEAWFDYNLSKILSVSASFMSIGFSDVFGRFGVFDARAFNIPREEVSNYFLWRALDWQRNSIQMYAQSFFSHKQLHKKNQVDMHEMLHSIGKNWTEDLDNKWKNGTWLIGDIIKSDILPNYELINNYVEKLIYESQ